MFGGKKADAGPTASESIQKLRDTENMLLKKQEFLEQKVEAETKIAKENATTNKRGKSKLIRPIIIVNQICETFVFCRSIFFVLFLFLCLRQNVSNISP